MRKAAIEIMGGAAIACVGFWLCIMIIGQLYHLCLVKKFAYATLIGMPLGSLTGIYLVDRFLFASKAFGIIGILAALAFTMIFLLVGIYVVTLAQAAFFTFPLLISLCCVCGLRLGSNIQLRRQVWTQHGNS